MKKVLIISASPYDETVGMAGTILKHKEDELHWLILTKPEESRWSETELKTKQQEVDKASKFYNFKTVRRLNFQTGFLSEISKIELTDVIRGNLEIVKPNIVYLPFDNTNIGDNAAAFKCSMAALRTFRAKIDRVLAYEVISPFSVENFKPNVYSDISDYIGKKQDGMNIFETEIQGYPLAKSIDSVKSLAKVRGASVTTEYAEAFMLIREII